MTQKQQIRYWAHMLDESNGQVDDNAIFNELTDVQLNKIVDLLDKSFTVSVPNDKYKRQYHLEFDCTDEIDVFEAHETANGVKHQGSFSSRAIDPDDYYGWTEGGELELNEVKPFPLESAGLTYEDLTDWDNPEWSEETQDDEYDDDFGNITSVHTRKVDVAHYCIQIKLMVKDINKFQAFLNK